MNILGFVFSLLLILALCFFTGFEKRMGSHRLRSTYLGHTSANRKILRTYENELYDNFPHKAKEKKPKSSGSQKKNKQPPELAIPPINPLCARINIGPLIDAGIRENRFLYDLTIKLFQYFYGEALFKNQPGGAEKFFNTFLEIAKLNPDLPMEKFRFGKPELQEIYYQMLKGTKKAYPSLLDYLIIERSEKSLICLFHAHPNLIAVLFNPKAAQKIYEEIHKIPTPPLTRELIEKVCSEAHCLTYPPEVFEMVKLGRPSHPKGDRRTLVETDDETAITLRKELYLKNS